MKVERAKRISQEMKDKIEDIRLKRRAFKRVQETLVAKKAFALIEKGYSLREIGNKLGISYEWARQISLRYEAGFYTEQEKEIQKSLSKSSNI